MRKEHKNREKRLLGNGKVQILNIIVVNYSVHSNNQNEYMQAYRSFAQCICYRYMHRMFVSSSSFLKTGVYTGMHFFCSKTYTLCFETFLVGAR